MKFLILFVTCIVLIHCKSDQTMMDTLQDHIQDYLKSNGHDLSIEEFSGLSELDTVTVKEYIDREMESLSLSLMNKTYRIKMMDSVETELRKILKVTPDDSTALTNLNDIETSRTMILRQQHAMDSLTAIIKPEMSQMIKFIAVKYAFNKKNAEGINSQHAYYVKLDEKLNVTDVTELNN